MIVTYVALGGIAVGLIAIVSIIWRKFPILASIDTATLQRHRQEKVKQHLIEHRLKRKLASIRAKNIFTRFRGEQTVPWYRRAVLFIKRLELRYRQQVYEVEAEDESALNKRRDLLYQQAIELRDAGKFAEAEDHLIEAISLDKKHTPAYERLGELYRETKDYDHALEVYQFLLKMTESEQHKTAEAEGETENPSVSLNHTLAGYEADLGEVYLLRGEPEAAMPHFKEAVKLEPNNPRYLDAIIHSALALKDSAIAKQYLTKLQEVNPENEKLSELKQAVKALK